MKIKFEHQFFFTSNEKYEINQQMKNKKEI